MANDVGRPPFTLPQPLKVFLHRQQLLNHIVTSVIVEVSLQGGWGGDVYTSTTTDLSYPEKEDVGVTDDEFVFGRK